MIHGLKVELYKLKGRYVFLVAVALVIFQGLWMLYDVSRGSDSPNRFMELFYNYPIMNAVMMPTIIAVIASRLIDTEHKGGTLLLMETMVSPGTFFDIKFLCGALFMLLIGLLQGLTILGVGALYHFGAVPWGVLGGYILFTFAISLMLLILQQIFSLWYKSQMVALSVGIIGSFVGLFSMFFPEGVQYFLPWSYYGILMQAGMDWNREAGTVSYYFVSPNWWGLAVVLIISGGLYGIYRKLFERREF